MLALMLDRETAERYALDIDGALPAGDLHITLAYLGDMAAIKQGKRVLAAAATDFAERFAPIAGRINGVGRFSADGDADPFYLSFDSPQLPDLRQSLIHWLELTGFSPVLNHGFIPHITLAYLPSSAESPLSTVEPADLLFSSLTLMWGAERQDFPLSGTDLQRSTSDSDVSDSVSNTDQAVTCEGDQTDADVEPVKERAMGKLASTLNTAIDDTVSDDMTRADVITKMAEAAGIESGTVNDILNGDITCPPMERLEGLASALGLSAASLVDAAKEDGCEYEERASRSFLMQAFGRILDAVGIYASEVSEGFQDDISLTTRSKSDVDMSLKREQIAELQAQIDALSAELEVDESADASDAEIGSEKERGLDLWQLEERVWQAVEDMSAATRQWYYLHEIFTDESGSHAIVIHEGNTYRADISVRGSDVTLGEMTRVEKTYSPVPDLPQPEQRSVIVSRADDGTVTLAIIAATPFLNRSGEIDSVDLLRSFEDYAVANEHYPVIDIYHLRDRTRIGQAYYVGVVDDFAYVALARMDDTPLARSMTAAIEAEPNYWGASVEYRYTERPTFEEVAENVRVAVYRSGINDYISILPEQDAANLLTATAVRRDAKDGDPMPMTSDQMDTMLKATAALDDSQREALIAQINGVADIGRSGEKIYRASEAASSDEDAQADDESATDEGQVNESEEAAGGAGETPDASEQEAPVSRAEFDALSAKLDELSAGLVERDGKIAELEAAKTDLETKVEAQANAKRQRELRVRQEAADTSERIANQSGQLYMASIYRQKQKAADGEQQAKKPVSSADFLKRTQQNLQNGQPDPDAPAD